MSNSFLDAWRQKMADLGTPDDREDTDIMYSDLIPLADQNKALLDQYPDFAQDYGKYREANAPSVAGEFGRAFKAGTEETGSTYAGLGALADIPGAAEESKKLEGEAAENAPTVASLEDIAPGEHGLSKIFSKDTVRYLAAKAGGVIPGLGEMVGLALGGAAVGSAIEPGVGTVAGAGEGALEEALGSGLVKSAIKNLVERKVLQDATEEGVADAIRAGNQKVASAVTDEAKRLAAGRAEAAVNLTNVYGMSAGGIYNETGDRGTALGLAVPAALAAAPPFISLPARVVRSLYPKLTGDAAKAAVSDLVGKKSAELLARLGRAGAASAVGTGGVVSMEAANIVAKNLTQGKDPLDLDASDWKRLREAAVAGAIGSAPFAAVAARSPTVEGNIPAGTPPAPEPAPPAAEVAPEPPAPATAPPEPTTLDVTRSVSQMDPAAAQARLAELEANPQRSDVEEAEYQQIKALAPEAEAPAPPEETPAANPAEVSADERPDQPAPDWLKDNNKALTEAAEKNGTAQKIEELAAQRMTASQIAAKLGVDEDTVRAVRFSREIPSMTTGAGPAQSANPEFEAWIASRTKPTPTEPPTVPTFQEAGFESEEHLAREYAAKGEHDVFESQDEFLNRIYCQNAA